MLILVRKNYLCICGKPSALCTVSGMGSGMVAPDPLPPYHSWWLLSALCLHSRIWLAAGVSKTLCPSVRSRESIPFQLHLLAFVFPVSFEIMAGSFALLSPGFTALCCCSNLQFGMGFSATVYYNVQSVDVNFIRVFCMYAAVDPVCTFLYT